MAVIRNRKRTSRTDSKNAGWWKDLLLIVGSCLAGNVIGAVASRFMASYLVGVLIERDGPVGAGDLKFFVCCFMCRLCGGLLGPFLVCLVPSRTPQFLTKIVISLGSGITWAVLFLNPLSPFNQ